jgi:hypothetical protein
MFTKEYPKSCTMFGTSFENSFKTNQRPSQAFFADTPIRIYFGSGFWNHPNIGDSGMFSTWKMAKNSLITGFRNTIYVQ